MSTTTSSMIILLLYVKRLYPNDVLFRIIGSWSGTSVDGVYLFPW